MNAEVERSLEARVAGLVEEYASAARRGAAPDREAFLARHPDVAEPLREALVAIEFILGANVGVRRPAAGTDGAAAGDGRVLGDFRIVREAGRGGMGVVYEAEQISLQRRVALKVLPFAAVLDPKQLQRFKHEAQAAAHLHHTNIVPIYSVGCERGVHYYAMQYIEGESLGQAVKELRGEGDGSKRSPISSHGSHRDAAYLRAATRIGLQAAEALDHAHQLGVVHRDVKPGNILVDATGDVWITDFGLARFGQQDNLTMTGDLVGTLLYMSPEQALAKRAPIDHRTDVYSLGATLYELFTLEPAVRATDPHEVVQEIALRDPRPPRQLNPSLPRDLETVILKALAKDPANRYATALEMADDLRRCLDDKPILAKRPALAERGLRWARRHRVVVGASAVLLVVVSAGLGVGNVLLAQEQKHAQDNYEEAERNFRTALDAIDAMLAEVGAESLTDVPLMDQVRRRLLERAVSFYDDRLLAGTDAADPRLRHLAANARISMGQVAATLGDGEAAKRAYQDALAALRALVEDHPTTRAYRIDAARCLGRIGVLASDDAATGDAETALHLARTEFQTLLAGDPMDPPCVEGLAVTEHEIARVLHRRGETAEAVAAARRAVDLKRRLASVPDGPARHQASLAASLQFLGKVLHTVDPPTESMACLEEATRLLGWVHEREPEVTAYRSDLARSLLDHGRLVEHVGRTQEALAAYERAAELMRRLVAEHPERLRYRYDFVRARSDQGSALHLYARDFDAALRCNDEVVQGLEQLVLLSPGGTNYPFVLAQMLQGRAQVLRRLGRADDEERALRRSCEIMERLAEPPQAQELSRERTLSTLVRAAKLNVITLPEVPDLKGHAGLAFNALAEFLQRRTRYSEAREAFERAYEIVPPDETNRPWALAWFHAWCPDTSVADRDLAFHYIAVAEERARLKGEDQSRDHRLWMIRAVASYRKGDVETAAEMLEKAFELRDDMDPGSEWMAAQWFVYAMVEWQRGRHDDARELYAKASAAWKTHWPDQLDLADLDREVAELLASGAR